MKRKPWPLVIISILYLLSPFANLLISSYLFDIDPIAFQKNIWASRSYFDLFTFYALPALTAWVIFIVKPWSYHVFLGLSLVTFSLNIHTWYQHPTVFKLPYLMAILFLNVLVVSYFLIPAVRQVYFNKKVRWWESKPRYKTEIEGQLRSQDQECHCSIGNLSRGGAYIRSFKNLEIGDKVEVNFSFLDIYFILEGVVVHKNSSDKSVFGYGVEFFHTPLSHWQMYRLCSELEKHQFPVLNRVEPWKEDFVHWLNELVKNGKGLLPPRF